MAFSSTLQDVIQASRGLGPGDDFVVWVMKFEPKDLVNGGTATFYRATVTYRGGTFACPGGLILPNIRVSVTGASDTPMAFAPGAAQSQVEASGFGFEADGSLEASTGINVDDLCNPEKYSWSSTTATLYAGHRDWTWGGSPDFEVALVVQIRGEPQWSTDRTAVTFDARASALYDADADIRDQQDLYFKGTGGLEGKAELAGKGKPLAYGSFKGHRPVPLDGDGRRWLVHGVKESIGSVTAVYEAGHALTVTTDYTVDTADGGIITLIEPARGVLTCDGTGSTAPSSSKAADIWDEVMQTHGGLTAGQTDLGTHATDYPETIGFVVPYDQAMTLGEAQARILGPASSSVQLLTSAAVKLVSDTSPRAASVDQTFEARDVERVETLQPAAPASVVRVGYGHIAKPLGEGEVLAADEFPERLRQSEEWRWAESTRITDTPYGNARPLELPSGITAKSDAETVAGSLIDVYRHLRQPYRVWLQRRVWGWVDLGDVAAFTFEDGAGNARFALGRGGETIDDPSGDPLDDPSDDPLLAPGGGGVPVRVTGFNIDLEGGRFSFEGLA